MIFSKEFKFLDIEAKKSARNQLSQNSYKKYSKILNNLLSISSRGDSAIFTKMNKTNYDLLKLIDENDIHKIFSKHDFKIKLIDKEFSKKNDPSLFITK